MKWPGDTESGLLCLLADTRIYSHMANIAESFCYIWYLLLLISSVGVTCICVQARAWVPPGSTIGRKGHPEETFIIGLLRNLLLDGAPRCFLEISEFSSGSFAQGLKPIQLGHFLNHFDKKIKKLR